MAIKQLGHTYTVKLHAGAHPVGSFAGAVAGLVTGLPLGAIAVAAFRVHGRLPPFSRFSRFLRTRRPTLAPPLSAFRRLFLIKLYIYYIYLDRTSQSLARRGIGSAGGKLRNKGNKCNKCDNKHLANPRPA